MTLRPPAASSALTTRARWAAVAAVTAVSAVRAPAPSAASAVPAVRAGPSWPVGQDASQRVEPAVGEQPERRAVAGVAAIAAVTPAAPGATRGGAAIAPRSACSASALLAGHEAAVAAIAAGATGAATASGATVSATTTGSAASAVTGDAPYEQAEAASRITAVAAATAARPLPVPAFLSDDPRGSVGHDLGVLERERCRFLGSWLHRRRDRAVVRRRGGGIARSGLHRTLVRLSGGEATGQRKTRYAYDADGPSEGTRYHGLTPSERLQGPACRGNRVSQTEKALSVRSDIRLPEEKVLLKRYARLVSGPNEGW